MTPEPSKRVAAPVLHSCTALIGASGSGKSTLLRCGCPRFPGLRQMDPLAA